MFLKENSGFYKLELFKMPSLSDSCLENIDTFIRRKNKVLCTYLLFNVNQGQGKAWIRKKEGPNELQVGFIVFHFALSVFLAQEHDIMAIGHCA